MSNFWNSDVSSDDDDDDNNENEEIIDEDNRNLEDLITEEKHQLVTNLISNDVLKNKKIHEKKKKLKFLIRKFFTEKEQVLIEYFYNTNENKLLKRIVRYEEYYIIFLVLHTYNIKLIQNIRNNIFPRSLWKNIIKSSKKYYDKNISDINLPNLNKDKNNYYLTSSNTIEEIEYYVNGFIFYIKNLLDIFLNYLSNNSQLLFNLQEKDKIIEPFLNKMRSENIIINIDVINNLKNIFQFNKKITFVKNINNKKILLFVKQILVLMQKYSFENNTKCVCFSLDKQVEFSLNFLFFIYIKIWKYKNTKKNFMTTNILNKYINKFINDLNTLDILFNNNFLYILAITFTSVTFSDKKYNFNLKKFYEYFLNNIPQLIDL